VGKIKSTFILGLLGLIAIGWFLYRSFQEDEIPSPKPRAYFRINMPPHEYRDYSGDCDFILPVSSFATVEKVNKLNVGDTCRFNLYYPKLKARIHCTYLPVSGNIHQLVEDAYGFATQHEMKADAIVRHDIEEKEHQVFGIWYELQGASASPIQFFTTDSTHHFLRGALYFQCPPNPDSLAPSLTYIQDDIKYLIKQMRWK
jgi:gliding motility-associated lipoprotein GldD